MPDIKLGSLFDGIGVFPLAASRCGIRPVWASEIEKAPISITKRHFPDMVHLGDITKVDGGKIPPVHIITFGSPCQNLSLIGNRSGLAGAKSSLFYQAFRIIQEMRDATDNLYPAIAVWENVMGAFSTNDRMDFRAVLSAFSDTELTGFPVSSTAKVMYCRMLDAMLSNGQEDENGILFVCFPVTAIAAVLSRSSMTVKRSLNELENAGLIKLLQWK